MISTTIIGILLGLFGFTFLKLSNYTFIGYFGFLVCIFGVTACFISVIVNIIKIIR